MQFKSSIHKKVAELAIGLFSVVALTLVGCGGGNNPAPAPPPGSGTNSGAASGQNTAVGSWIADHLNGSFVYFVGGGIPITAGPSASLDVSTFTAAGANTYSEDRVTKTLTNGVWGSVPQPMVWGANEYYLGAAGWVKAAGNLMYVDSGDGSNVTVGFSGFSIRENVTKASLAYTPISCGATACAVPGNYPAGATAYAETFISDVYWLNSALAVTDTNGVAMTALPGIGATFCDPGLSQVYSAIPGAAAGASNYKVFALPAGGCTAANIASAQLGVATNALLSNQATGNAVVPNVLRVSNYGILGLRAGNVWTGSVMFAQTPSAVPPTATGERNKIAINAELAAYGLAQIP